MTKEVALFNFWKSFGIPAYVENSVPVTAVFPYITYQVVTDSFGSDVALTASIWDKDRDGYSAFTAINAKKDEISNKIGLGGKVVTYDGGAIWIRRGSPFAQDMPEPSDDTVHRKLLTITAEYISAD